MQRLTTLRWIPNVEKGEKGYGTLQSIVHALTCQLADRSAVALGPNWHHQDP